MSTPRVTERLLDAEAAYWQRDSAARERERQARFAFRRARLQRRFDDLALLGMQYPEERLAAASPQTLRAVLARYARVLLVTGKLGPAFDADENKGWIDYADC